jgi:DNA-directed RNA polymerase subunit beta'
MPIVTEVSGYVKYGDIIDGVTMQESLDEITGMSRKTIIESKDADSRPRITLKDADGNTSSSPPATERRGTSSRANIFLNDGDSSRPAT